MAWNRSCSVMLRTGGMAACSRFSVAWCGRVVACTASPHHSVSRSLMSACAASFFCSDTVATWSIEKCVICSRIFCAHKFNKKQFLKSMKKFNVETGIDQEVSLYLLGIN